MFIDDLIPATDIGSWLEDEARKEKEGKQDILVEFSLKETAPNNIGLVNFLSDGLRLTMHTVKTVHKGKTIFGKFLCKGTSCPLCASGNVAREQGVYPLLDWDNGYVDRKTNKKISFPTIKMFIKGVNTVKLIERRRAKLGTLINKMFEVTREGSGLQTTYDFIPEKDMIPDFAEVKVGDKGTTYFAIKRPEKFPKPIPGSLLDLKKVNIPDYAPDWSNPKHANLYVQLYLLNADPKFYTLDLSADADNDHEADASQRDESEQMPF